MIELEKTYLAKYLPDGLLLEKNFLPAANFAENYIGILKIN